MKKSKHQAHQRYYVKGKRVPGASTIANLYVDNLEPLLYWAWNLGIEDKDYKEVRRSAGNIGTATHEMIECEDKGLEFDRSKYSEDVLDKAENAFLAYLDWKKKNVVKSIIIEEEFVSESYKFGGTPDRLFLNPKEQNILVDFKTSSGIYPTHIIQLAGYWQLLTENDYTVHECWILKLGKEYGDFLPRKIPNEIMQDAWKIFVNLREIYDSRKSLKKICK